MDRPDLNPLIIMLLYILRCLVPLGIMLGISYLLRRFGFIKEPPRPPADWENNHKPGGADGGVSHG